MPSQTEFALGTVCTVTLYEQGKDKIYKEVFARIREIENQMSVNIPASDISRVNAAAGIEFAQVTDEVLYVFDRALYYTRETDGAFNPAIGPLVSLWDITSLKPRIPPQQKIDEVLSLINSDAVAVDMFLPGIYLLQPGMALDLGGIAKGYAADEAAKTIQKHGVKRAIIDLGGDILVIGENKEKRPWRVGIQNPLEPHGVFLGVLQISAKNGQQSVVTSGTYERFFEEDGNRYHHIFSPFTGYPVDNELLSVTIIAQSAMDADALCTATFVLGYEKGRALIDSLPDTEAVFVFKDNSIRKTGDVNLTITDDSFFKFTTNHTNTTNNK